VTGIAGPGGSSVDKPVGLVYIALSDKNLTSCERYVFPGERAGIRRRAVYAALDMLRLRLLEKGAGTG